MAISTHPTRSYNVAKVAAGFAVYCDGDLVHTPAGVDLVAPTLSLAEALALEWGAQGKKINPSLMPLMQFVATALDLVPRDRDQIIARTLRYTQTELLCYRASYPEELLRRQEALWQPWLNWCASQFGAFLKSGTGVVVIDQELSAVSTLARAVSAYDDFSLVGLSHAVEMSGSLVLGLALAHKRLSAAEVHQLAQLDENYQLEMWGEDPALRKRQDEILRDLAACERWFSLLT